LTPEQEALLRKAKRSVEAARTLLENLHPDFAVARAYYAMFYTAEAALLGRGLSFSKHSAVHAAFGREFVRNGDVPVEFHRMLLDAARYRAVGDYDALADISVEDATRMTEAANRFIETLKATLVSEDQ